MTDLDNLRYPIGRFRMPASSLPDVRAGHIQVLRELPERLAAAVDGLNDAQFDTPYRDGGWTVRQLVHHVFDSHANSYIRFKLALTEDWPTITAYDEKAWAMLHGRNYVIPDDVQRLARPVLAHRLLPTAEAIVERHLPEQVVDRIVTQLPLPRR